MAGKRKTAGSEICKESKLILARAAYDRWTVMFFPSGLRKGKATNESYQHRSSVLTGTFDHGDRLHKLFCYVDVPV